MAFLMLLHEKMRLQRKQNKLTLKQLRNSNQLSRMESRIKKREKYYSKLEKQIDTQGNYYKNMGKTMINNTYGGAAGWSPNTLFAGGGVGFGSTMGNCIEQACSRYNVDSKYVELYMTHGTMAFHKDDTKFEEKTNATTGKKEKVYEVEVDGYGTINTEQYGDIMQAAQYAKQLQSQQSQFASQMALDYENQVSIWVQAQKDELEMQQEWEMDLLAEEQADYEAEKESIAAELELVKQRKEAIEQELGQSIKDAAPKFGLA